MGSKSGLGPFQQQLLYALLRLGDQAYGMSIWEELEKRTGQSLSIGAVYVSLERLERKGFVTSHMGDPTPQRGGRAKRHYLITGAGAQALQDSERFVACLKSLVPRAGTEV